VTSMSRQAHPDVGVSADSIYSITDALGYRRERVRSVYDSDDGVVITIVERGSWVSHFHPVAPTA
jgi:hypothetical protein